MDLIGAITADWQPSRPEPENNLQPEGGAALPLGLPPVPFLNAWESPQDHDGIVDKK